MSQHHMDFDPGHRRGSASDSVGDEEVPYDSYSSSSSGGQKLSWQDTIMHPTAGHRLTLALVSLVLFTIVIFGLIGIAVATRAPAWAVLPILFILVLFSALAVIINIVFNRTS